MHANFFFTVVLVAFLLSICRIDAQPIIKNKAKPENTSQTAAINNKRDTMSPSYIIPSTMDAGGIMQSIIHPGNHQSPKKNDDDPEDQPIQPPTTPTVEDPRIVKMNQAFASVNASLNALMVGVQNDDSIVGEIKKMAPEAMQLLQKLEKEFDPKDLDKSKKTFSELLKIIEKMAAQVVEQDDDAEVRTLLANLDKSLHAVEYGFQSFSPSTDSNHTPNANPGGDDGSIATTDATRPPPGGISSDLAGVDSAISGQQEA